MPEYENGNDLSYKLFEKNVDEAAEPDAKTIIATLETSGSIHAPLCFHGGSVLFGSNDHHIYRVSASGELVWKYRTGGISVCSPLVHGGVAYAGSFDGFLYAISFDDGKLLWRFRTGGRVVSSPVVFDGKLCFGSEDHYLYCITFEGEEVWKFRANGEVYSTPVIIGNDVCFGCCDKRIYCVRDGRLVWSYLTGGIVGAVVAIDNNGDEFFGIRENKCLYSEDEIRSTKIFAGSFDTNYYMLSTDGRLLWKFKTGESSSVTKPATAKDGVAYFGNFDKYLYALSVEDGKLLWKFLTGGPLSTTPLIYNNSIYFGSFDGYFYALTLHGDLIWKLHTGGGITSAPVIEDDILYFGSLDTFLYAVSIKEPRVIWKFQTGFGFPGNMNAAIEIISKISKLQRAIGRIWMPETKPSAYEKPEDMQKNFTFGPAYRGGEPYKSGVEYDSGTQYSMDRKKKDWRPV